MSKKQFVKSIRKKGTALLLGVVLCCGSFNVTAEAASVTKITIAGSNRYGTSEAAASKRLSLQGKSKANALFVASGSAFADALSGVSLAKMKDAPLILHKANDNATTLQRIRSYLNTGQTVYVLGGDAAVSYSLDSQIIAAGFKVKRLAGENRHFTNLMILREAYGDERTKTMSLNGNAAESQIEESSEENEAGSSMENAAESSDIDDMSAAEASGADENASDTQDGAFYDDQMQSNYVPDINSPASEQSTEQISEAAGQLTDLNQTGTSAVSEDTDDPAKNSTETSAESLSESSSSNISEAIASDEESPEDTMESISEEIVSQDVEEDLNSVSSIKKLLVCSSENYPDALSASATGLPILIVNKSLDDEKRSFLTGHTIGSIDVIGGTSVMPDSLMTELKKYTSGGVQRISGSTRYTTSVEVAKHYFTSNPTTAAIAQGTNFPDALSSGQITTLLNIPLILIAPGSALPANNYLSGKVKTVYIFGGSSVMPEWNVRQAVGELPGYTAKYYLGDNRSGGKTLKNLIQNALIPAGRTLYVFGGGWGDEEAGKIGYLSGWGQFFSAHGNATYNRKLYEYTRLNGLDCSGYIGWVVYNTMYTKNNQASILYGNGTAYTSTQLANRIASLGYASYRSGQVKSFSQLKPGDIVSMEGHIWMSLGTCSDGSALILHSSPMGQTYGGGVQLCGTGSTNSQSYKLAKMYNAIYFPYWPYPTLVVSDSYLTKSVGLARWNNDPDGLRNMSANQVMAAVLGPV